MSTFLGPMGILITIAFFLVWLGEDKFNKMFNRFRCAHKYKYYDRQGKEDNRDSHEARCIKCGHKIIIEE
jgi:DNA-directed RNA polymerase subunit RPC12/RpoP